MYFEMIERLKFIEWLNKNNRVLAYNKDSAKWQEGSDILILLGNTIDKMSYTYPQWVSIKKEESARYREFRSEQIFEKLVETVWRN